ncbi:type IX secretion system plug protein [Mucilaginibacter boryungensis]|uniref:DUF5103 domain-containing protein n=1 Tax=Mucilaginibacter boryungensis TaxID=768480 RepID=A0ABR9XE02_9SPHI|nr:DUF5103 domain-containing protein [Mucilaginibacter boryungensis]MBE9665304.1 DUF5103 domain-containing protein [Mucilaginibacter boryungensis]
MKRYIFLLLVFITLRSIAQKALVYDDMVYRPEIKSVQFSVVGKESSFPVINLRSGEQVMLAFDDLRGNTRNYNYTIEHCDAEWNSSNLSPSQYLQSFNEDRLTEYRYSSATRQKYVHYELVLPNQTIAPKIAGNYLLKVYENSDQDNPIITRRLYVLGNRVSTFAEIIPSPNTALRETNQKINFTLDYAGLNVQNPYTDLRTFIMQNARPETRTLSNKPSQIRGTQLVYNDVTTNDFPGGNEFRHFDTRSLLTNSERIGHIYRDTVNTVILLTDYNRDKPGYTFEYDNDGKFFINTQDSRDARTEADYAHVYFNLATNKTIRDGTPYIVGQFNNWRIDANSKLRYDGGRFYTDLFLKQGVYDYAYVWVDTVNNPDYTLLEGNHFETENDYQLLVYYRPVGARWDELVGYRLLNNGLNKR